eukprot:g18555.t1
MWNGWCPDVGNNGNVIHIQGGVKGYGDAQGRSVFALRGIRFYGTLRQGHAPRTCWQKKKQLEAKKKKHVEHVGKHSKHRKEVVKEGNEAGKAEPGGAGGNSTTTAPVPVGAERDEGEKAAPAVALPPKEESDPGKAASMEMCCGGVEEEAATLPPVATTKKITKTKKIVKEVKTTKKAKEEVKK